MFMKYLILSILFLVTNCATSQSSVETDVASALTLLNHQMEIAHPAVTLDYICRELRPITDTSVKNYLIANSHRFEAYTVSDYFGKQDQLKLLTDEV